MIGHYSSNPTIKLGTGADLLHKIVTAPEHETFLAYIEDMAREFGGLLSEPLPKSAQRKTRKFREVKK